MQALPNGGEALAHPQVGSGIYWGSGTEMYCGTRGVCSSRSVGVVYGSVCKFECVARNVSVDVWLGT
jgi:hypothetical protein